jgi:hypothetical protein
MGWSAGKWGEWYPDILGSDGKLTTAVAKPYLQKGWLAQHDRILGALGARRDRIPLMISVDLHAIGSVLIVRYGATELDDPVCTVLSGPIGTNPTGWPSGRRGIGPTVPAHLDVRGGIAPIEEHGFTIADFFADHIELQFFKWKVGTDPESAIDTLEPFSRITRDKP